MNPAAILHPSSRVSKVIAVALAIAVCALIISSMRAGAVTQTASAPASSDDTEIRSANRMVNQGSATTITVDGDKPAGTGRSTAALIRFSLPTLPAGATITDTELRLNVTNSSTETYSVFVMKKAWVEGEATWNMYRTASVWDLAGGRGATDRESPAIAGIAPGATGVQYFDLGAAFDQQVGDWMSGEEANDGIQLISTGGKDGFDFSTREVDTASQRPQLIINYDEDTTPPETTISSGAAEGETLTVDSATFGFSSSETGSTFECSLDGDDFASCSSPQSYTNLSDGSHIFQVKATDAAGNTDTTPASTSFSVDVPPPPPPADTTPPETAIDSAPSGTLSSTSASFTFSSSEANSTFECKLDAGPFGSCTSPENYANLSDGSHTFEVRSTDAAGNTDTTPASTSFSVDVPPPPPPDSDRDGVTDDVDACPNEEGPSSNQGCPIVTPPPPPAACADGVDNDGDSLVDLSDPGCADSAGTDEADSPPPPSTNNRMHGAFIGAPTTASIDAFTTLTGQQPEMVMWYINWDGHLIDRAHLDAAASRGAIPNITWEPFGRDPGAIASGQYDSYIRSQAQVVRNFGKPVMLRPFHEFNGDWYSWSMGAGNSPAELAAAYRHVVDVFNSEGATNALWLWSPNVDHNLPLLDDAYPGDAYVDYVALDGYNWGPTQSWGSQWQSCTSVFKSTYDSIASWNTTDPMIVGESSSTEIGGDKAAWIRSCYQTEIPQNMPRIKGFVWFHTNKEQDWRVNSGANSLNAYKQVVADPSWQGTMP